MYSVPVPSEDIAADLKPPKETESVGVLENAGLYVMVASLYVV